MSDQLDGYERPRFVMGQVDHAHPPCPDSGNEKVGADVRRIARTKILHRRLSLRRCPDLGPVWGHGHRVPLGMAQWVYGPDSPVGIR